jgi:predicted DNA-binding protein
MAATRTQIYLTARQRERLDELTAARGVPMAFLVREAIDHYLEDAAPDLEAALEASFGVMPELVVPSRGEWDSAQPADRH